MNATAIPTQTDIAVGRPATRRFALRALATTLALLSCSATPAAPTQHYWYDGAVRRSLFVDDSQHASFGAEKAAPSAVLKAGPAVATAKSLDRVSPVFRDHPGGSERALPGGVIVRLRQPMAADQARALLESQGLQPVRALGGSSTVWLVASDAGLGSLALANRLHESGLFESASPNWWQHRALK